MTLKRVRVCKIKKNVKVYIITIKIVTINRSTNWLKVESKIMAIYRIYKPYTMWALRDRLNDAMSCDSLIIIRIYLKQFSADMLLLNAVLKLADGGAVLRGSLSKSVPLDFALEKLLPYIFIINTTIHPNNEIAVRMRKLFILLPFPAFHCWTTVSG